MLKTSSAKHSKRKKELDRLYQLAMSVNHMQLCVIFKRKYGFDFLKCVYLFNAHYN